MILYARAKIIGILKCVRYFVIRGKRLGIFLFWKVSEFSFFFVVIFNLNNGRIFKQNI